jgi:RimJ/RimL family protein N-acetyltransferase
VIYELKPTKYDIVRPLFADLIPYNVIIAAAIEGTTPGRVYVDHPTEPRSAFLCSVEGYFLAGNPNNTAFNAALKQTILDTIFAGDTLRAGDTELFVDCTPAAWIDRLAEIFPRPVLINPRQHYVCTALAFDWRAHLPDGFAVRRVDQALLDTPGLDLPEHMLDWMQTNWGSRAAFLARGFGFCTVHDHRVASWSIADCASGDTCEIGIHTHPDYRRRGLAAIAAAAAVDYALAHGYTSVGWHCNFDNHGSIRTAQKVGFVKERDYVHYYCMASELEQVLETAHMHYRLGDTRAETDWLARACTYDDVPVWAFSWAGGAFTRLGDYEAALRYLHQAVDRGWANRQALEDDTFAPLRTMPGWQALLARLEAQPIEDTQP